MQNSSKNCRKKFEDKRFKSNPMTETETREKAVLWAKSMKYPIPSKMGGCLSFILMITDHPFELKKISNLTF